VAASDSKVEEQAEGGEGDTSAAGGKKKGRRRPPVVLTGEPAPGEKAFLEGREVGCGLGSALHLL
jgi:hypothetical protein